MLLQLPYLLRFKGPLLAGSIGFVLGVLVMLAVAHWPDGKDRPMTTALASVPTYTVKVPEGKGVVVQDKKVLREAGVISKQTADDPNKAVTATGKVETSDGTKMIAAVLDMSNWDTVLVEKRPFSEFMSRHEFGVGFGLVDGDLAWAAQYRFTFGRIWKLYGTVQAEAFQVDRTENKNPWNAMAFVNLNFR